MHLAAGAAGVAAGLLTAAGAAAPALTMRASMLAVDPQLPALPARLAALVAGTVCAALGLVVMVAGVRVRPTLSVAWATVPLTASFVLAPALAATAAPSDLESMLLVGTALPPYRLAVGFWLLCAGVACSAVAALMCLVAGNTDRDADRSLMPGDDRAPSGAVRAAAAVAGVLAVASLLAPVYIHPVGPWIGRSALPSVETWGQLLAAIVLGGVAWLLPRSRPARAVALAAGGAATAIVYALLAHGPVGSAPGPGSYCAVASAVAFLLVAGLIVAIARRDHA